MSSLKKFLFVPDVHVPYEDKRAFNVLLKSIKEFQPDTLILLGDFLDLWTISAHPKDFKVRPSLAQELEVGSRRLAQLEVAAGTKCKLVYISGNHEHRLERYLCSEKGAPFLKPLVSAGLVDLDRATIPNLLKLKERGWSWVPYKEHAKFGKLHVTHDLGKAGAAAHTDAEATFQSNAVIGHTHHMSYTVRGNMKGKAHVGAMFGWLGDLKEVDYMYRARALRDWSHGFGIAHQQANGVTHVTPVPIINYTCVVNGKLIKA
jgi:predicted phosphodiesterase